MVMKKRYIILFLLSFVIFSLYINRNIYYISRWHMYVKIENSQDTTTVYLSNSRWHFEDNYIKYCPQSAEISYLGLNPIKDTLYAIAKYMEIIEIHAKDYNVKAVRFARTEPEGSKYWSDSTFIKDNSHDWIDINHRHGIWKNWEHGAIRQE